MTNRTCMNSLVYWLSYSSPPNGTKPRIWSKMFAVETLPLLPLSIHSKHIPSSNLILPHPHRLNYRSYHKSYKAEINGLIAVSKSIWFYLKCTSSNWIQLKHQGHYRKSIVKFLPYLNNSIVREITVFCQKLQVRQFQQLEDLLTYKNYNHTLGYVSLAFKF